MISRAFLHSRPERCNSHKIAEPPPDPTSATHQPQPKPAGAKVVVVVDVEVLTVVEEATSVSVDVVSVIDVDVAVVNVDVVSVVSVDVQDVVQVLVSVVMVELVGIGPHMSVLQQPIQHQQLRRQVTAPQSQHWDWTTGQLVMRNSVNKTHSDMCTCPGPALAPDLEPSRAIMATENGA